MNRSLVVLEMLRNKSIELQMKSDALLSGYVTEQVALKLAQCDIKHKFLLKNGNDLELSAYKREVYGKLIYAYQKDPDEDFYASVALFFDQKMNRETEDGLIFSWEIKRQTDRVMIRLHARIGDRRVPVHIQVDRTNPQKNPQERSIRLIMENSKSEKLLLYPYVTQIFEDYSELLEKLSLLQDMSVLERIYEGLEHTLFEGRDVARSLTRLEEEHHLKMDEQRYHQFLSCVNNPYLKKRWNAYKKKRSLTKPEYEALMSRLISFLKPVWEERLAGMVYLGSWLPELGRYLD